MLPQSSQQNGKGPGVFKWKPQKTLWGQIKQMLSYLNTQVLQMNQSKIFAGLVIIVLNISSKFVTIKLSKSMESYLKNTFSRDALIFAMAWMGTRDIYTAVLMTLIFKLAADYLLNEESRMCCLPESFTDYHLSMEEKKFDENNPPSKDEVEHAQEILKRAGVDKE